MLSLDELKKNVWKANMDLQKYGLVVFTWGNASGIDRELGLIVIKPSGVEYDKLQPEDMVVIDLEGNQVDGTLNPSSDTATHLVLYRNFTEIGGIVHTHSTYATSWAQGGKSIPALGTTHADYFYGDVPCTRSLSREELQGKYEEETGKVIVECFQNINPIHVPGVLVASHGPFSWGKDAYEAVYHGVVLEEIAKMALHTCSLSPNVKSMDQMLLDKHFLRKHGQNAYYGQKRPDVMT